MEFSFEKEHAKAVAAYQNPLTIAEKVRRDYKLMPAPTANLTDCDEFQERREDRRVERENQQENDYNDPRHDGRN